MSLKELVGQHRGTRPGPLDWTMGRKNRFDTESDDSMNREAVWIWRVKRAWSSKQEQRYSVTGEDEVGRFLRNDWKAFADAAKLAPIGWSEASRASKQFCSLQHHPANSMILSYPGRQQTAWRSCTSILVNFIAVAHQTQQILMV